MILNKNVSKIAWNYIRRNIHKHEILSSPGAYDGDGKTTVYVLNKEDELGLMIDSYSQAGFRLNNNVTVLGSIAVFRRSVLSWSISDVSEITEESFSLFSILEPALDILVLGVGDKIENFNFFQKIIPFSKKFKIPFEILPTDQACATFNFLNAEGRNVAGALIPPKYLEATVDDELQTKIRYENLYNS